MKYTFKTYIPIQKIVLMVLGGPGHVVKPRPTLGMS